jgi:hypothetical protein
MNIRDQLPRTTQEKVFFELVQRYEAGQLKGRLDDLLVAAYLGALVAGEPTEEPECK